jgi:hypothetical protein
MWMEGLDVVGVAAFYMVWFAMAALATVGSAAFFLAAAREVPVGLPPDQIAKRTQVVSALFVVCLVAFVLPLALITQGGDFVWKTYHGTATAVAFLVSAVSVVACIYLAIHVFVTRLAARTAEKPCRRAPVKGRLGRETAALGRPSSRSHRDSRTAAAPMDTSEN